MKRHTKPLDAKHREIVQRPEYQERFWSYVDRTGDCWVWKGARFGNGYGAFRILYMTTNAHRIAWEIEYGPVGADQWVLHKCESNYTPGDLSYRLCVRPDHLYLGSPKDNGEDRVQSGRMVFNIGRANPTAVLDESSVLAIRICYATGRFTQGELATIFGIQRATVGDVIRRKHFRWVREPESVRKALIGLVKQRTRVRQTTLWTLLDLDGNSDRP